VVDLLNTGTDSQNVQIGLHGVAQGGWATPYLTDAGDQVAAQQQVQVRHGQLSVSAPPRSVVSVVLPADS
jgi:hypothetical protein